MPFSEKIPRILDTAKQLAISQKATSVKKTHVLLALIKSNDNLVSRLLQTMHSEETSIAETLNKNLIPGKKQETIDLQFSAEIKPIMDTASREAEKFGSSYAEPIHLLLAFILDPAFSDVWKKHNISYQTALDSIKNLYTIEGKTTTPFLKEFGSDLVEKADKGELDPVIDRSNETERIIQILCRRRKNNPVLFGGPGVGKTAIVEGIAALIAQKKVPPELQDKKIIELSLQSVIAGASKRGEYEERIKRIIDEVKNANGKIILFIDEIHTLVSENNTDNTANILKPALARGEIQAIGATTEAEYRKYFEKDTALERRFEPVFIAEPSQEDCFIILKGVKKKYEDFHGIKIPDETLEYAITLSERFITDRLLPDKAIGLIDEACASLKIPEFSIPKELEAKHELLKYSEEGQTKAESQKNIPLANKYRKKIESLAKEIAALEKQYREITAEKSNTLTPFTLQQMVSQATGIPLSHVREEESERLLHIEEILRQNVIGQDEAVKTISEAILRNRAGLKKKNRPIGSFIFMGPTGVGKTELAKTLAQYLFGTKNALVRFDMSEFMEKHSSARLVGAPRGYIGYEEGGQLTEAIRLRPYSVILFDEIEKANTEIFNLLLQILDEGQLTDAKGQFVNFKNTIVICTSNLGGQTIDFAKIKSLEPREQKNTLVKELRKLLQPELINRFDDIILFNFLNRENIENIVNLMLRETLDNLQEKNISLSLDDNARKKLSELGYDPVFGARPLRYIIQQEIDNPLSKMILRKEIAEGDQLTCIFDNENFVFRKLSS